jgi:hypothetical protein
MRVQVVREIYATCNHVTECSLTSSPSFILNPYSDITLIEFIQRYRAYIITKELEPSNLSRHLVPFLLLKLQLTCDRDPPCLILISRPADKRWYSHM